MTTPTDTPSLNALVLKLAMQRTESATRRAQLTARVKAFEETIAFETAALKQAEADAKATEAEVKALAQIEFERTGDKTLYGGIKVQQTESVEITDPVAALTFAKTSGVGYVPETYDAKALCEIAKASKTRLLWATKQTGYRVTIPTDLTKHLDTGMGDLPAAA